MSDLFDFIRNFKKRLIRIDMTLPMESFGSEYGGFSLFNMYSENENLIVYSFGIGEDLSFSNDIAEKFNCREIYAFDPTPKSMKYVETQNLYHQPYFHFYKWGLSDKCEDCVFFCRKMMNMFLVLSNIERN